jgi:hypothetical protein
VNLMRNIWLGPSPFSHSDASFLFLVSQGSENPPFGGSRALEAIIINSASWFFSKQTFNNALASRSSGAKKKLYTLTHRSSDAAVEILL